MNGVGVSSPVCLFFSFLWFYQAIFVVADLERMSNVAGFTDNHVSFYDFSLTSREKQQAKQDVKPNRCAAVVNGNGKSMVILTKLHLRKKDFLVWLVELSHVLTLRHTDTLINSRRSNGSSSGEQVGPSWTQLKSDCSDETSSFGFHPKLSGHVRNDLCLCVCVCACTKNTHLWVWPPCVSSQEDWGQMSAQSEEVSITEEDLELIKERETNIRQLEVGSSAGSHLSSLNFPSWQLLNI